MRYILGLSGIMKKKTETVIIGYSIYWGYIYIYVYIYSTSGARCTCTSHPHTTSSMGSGQSALQKLS